jgi:hypothetical protein
MAYYLADGFEVLCPNLAAQKQVARGGVYEGAGFATGVDLRVLARFNRTKE